MPPSVSLRSAIGPSGETRKPPGTNRGWGWVENASRGRSLLGALRARPGPQRAYETSGRSITASRGHVLNNKHGRLTTVVVPKLYHTQHPGPQRDHIPRAPVGNGTSQRRRIGRHACPTTSRSQAGLPTWPPASALGLRPRLAVFRPLLARSSTSEARTSSVICRWGHTRSVFSRYQPVFLAQVAEVTAVLRCPLLALPTARSFDPLFQSSEHAPITSFPAPKRVSASRPAFPRPARRLVCASAKRPSTGLRGPRRS